MSSIVPIPKFPIHIRTATMADIPFMDALQKKYAKALGYFTRKQFEGYVEPGHVLIAEREGGRPIGYLISKDRYLKRNELGVIFQLCVAPDVQRGFVGATLVRTAFERSAYGCRLYCLWCAQDLDANRFWESLGFVPIAFRAGSDRKKRVHIFWQKRIVDRDTETKWWYPCKTEGGALGADRIVFPIPPGVHWSEVTAPEIPGAKAAPTLRLRLPAPKRAGETPAARVKKTNAPGPKPGQVAIVVGGRLKYIDRPDTRPPAVALQCR
jgi:N-acetylglutamate synthase-like GNAT family acetyltransferase